MLLQFIIVLLCIKTKKDCFFSESVEIMAVIDLANYALGQNDSQFEESDLSDIKDKFQVLKNN